MVAGESQGSQETPETSQSRRGLVMASATPSAPSSSVALPWLLLPILSDLTLPFAGQARGSSRGVAMRRRNKVTVGTLSQSGA